MKYTVTWVKSAEERLAQLWMDSRFASRITIAADWFDQTLSKTPYEVGESRPANLRIAFYSPLAILFVVEEPECRVIILDVWAM